MEDFRYYSPEDVIYENLRETAIRMELLCEQELAHLRELAAQLTKDISGSSDFTGALRDLLPQALDMNHDTLLQNADLVERTRGFRRTIQRLLLCMMLRDGLQSENPLSPEQFFPDTEEVPFHASNRIAYQRSSYADTAYLLFSKILSTPRAVYTHGFPAACEEVFNSLCEYCILPLENSSEGKLNTFSHLIERYDLKIAATADICATDGSRITKFALLRRTPTPILQAHADHICLAITLPLADIPTPAELLSAAQLCGLTVTSIDSLPNNDTPPRSVVHYVFRGNVHALTAFLLYLESEAPSYDTVGIYPSLTDCNSH